MFQNRIRLRKATRITVEVADVAPILETIVDQDNDSGPDTDFCDVFYTNLWESCFLSIYRFLILIDIKSLGNMVFMMKI